MKWTLKSVEYAEEVLAEELCQVLSKYEKVMHKIWHNLTKEYPMGCAPIYPLLLCLWSIQYKLLYKDHRYTKDLAGENWRLTT